GPAMRPDPPRQRRPPREPSPPRLRAPSRCPSPSSDGRAVRYGKAPREGALTVRSGPEPGGGRGIRTPEGLTALAVFKTAPINHSGIPPCPHRMGRGGRRAGRSRGGDGLSGDGGDGILDAAAGRWLSGRKRPPAKRVRGVKLLRGFESLPSRQPHHRVGDGGGGGSAQPSREGSPRRCVRERGNLVVTGPGEGGERLDR